VVPEICTAVLLSVLKTRVVFARELARVCYEDIGETNGRRSRDGLHLDTYRPKLKKPLYSGSLQGMGSHLHALRSIPGRPSVCIC